MGRGEQTVLLCDDHQLVAQLLASSVSAEPDLVCVGVAHDAATALRTARETIPDVVVMDVRLGDGDGIGVARELLAELPRTRVIVLTAFADSRLARRAADAGASALVAKDGQVEVLLDLIRSAVRGSFVSGPGIPTVRQPADRLAAAGLDPQDAEVLRLLAAGRDEEGVARELRLDQDRARRRVRSVLEALGADSPRTAVSAAVERGLLRVGPR